MGAYADQPWAARSLVLGDKAEGEFETRYEGGWVRVGIHRPPFSVKRLHPFVKQMPDYLTGSGWVEVMGLGSDQILKLKIEKLAALQFWGAIQPLTLWVWDSHKKRSTEVPLDLLVNLAAKAEVKTFADGIAYYAIPAKLLFPEVS